MGMGTEAGEFISIVNEFLDWLTYNWSQLLNHRATSLLNRPHLLCVGDFFQNITLSNVIDGRRNDTSTVYLPVQQMCWLYGLVIAKMCSLLFNIFRRNGLFFRFRKLRRNRKFMRVSLLFFYPTKMFSPPSVPLFHQRKNEVMKEKIIAKNYELNRGCDCY